MVTYTYLMKNLDDIEWTDITSAVIDDKPSLRMGYSSLDSTLDMGSLTVQMRMADLTNAALLHTSKKQLQLKENGFVVFEGISADDANIDLGKTTNLVYAKLKFKAYSSLFSDAKASSEIVWHDVKVNDPGDAQNSLLHKLFGEIKATSPLLSSLSILSGGAVSQKIIPLVIIEEGESLEGVLTEFLRQNGLAYYMNVNIVNVVRPYDVGRIPSRTIAIEDIIEKPSIQQAPYVEEEPIVVKFGKIVSKAYEQVYELNANRNDDGSMLEHDEIPDGEYYPVDSDDEPSILQADYQTRFETDDIRLIYSTDQVMTITAKKGLSGTIVDATLTKVKADLKATGADIQLRNDEGELVSLYNLVIKAHAYYRDFSERYGDKDGEEIDGIYLSDADSAKDLWRVIRAEQKAEKTRVRFTTHVEIEPNTLISLTGLPYSLLVRYRTRKLDAWRLFEYECVAYQLTADLPQGAIKIASDTRPQDGVSYRTKVQFALGTAEAPYKDGDIISADGLVAWYPLNGDTLDYSGNDAHGVASGGAVADSGLNAGAYSFNFSGSASKVEAPNHIPKGSNLTVSLWYYQRSIKPYNESLINIASGRGSANGFWIFFDTSIPTIGVRVETTKALYSPTLSLDTWYHAVVIFDGTTGKIFIDGVLVATGSINDITTEYTTDNPLAIGNLSYTNSLGFDGLIQDVRIYNRVLSAEEITTIYENQGHFDFIDWVDWQETPPTPAAGEYVWRREATYLPPSEPTDWVVTRLTGDTGQKGDKGDKGDTGPKGDDAYSDPGFVVSITPSEFQMSARGVVLETQSIKFKITRIAIDAEEQASWDSLGPVDFEIYENQTSGEGEEYTGIPGDYAIATIDRGTTIDSFTVSCELASLDKQTFVIKGVRNGVAKGENFGGISDVAKIPTTFGVDPLINGDYFLWTAEDDEYALAPDGVVKTGEVYEYRNGLWIVSTNQQLYMNLLPEFMDIANTSDSEVIGNAIIKKLATIEAFIHELTTKELTLSQNGSITSSYEDNGVMKRYERGTIDDPDLLEDFGGFYLGADGYMELVRVRARDGEYSGVLESTDAEGTLLLTQKYELGRPLPISAKTHYLASDIIPHFPNKASKEVSINAGSYVHAFKPAIVDGKYNLVARTLDNSRTVALPEIKSSSKVVLHNSTSYISKVEYSKNGGEFTEMSGSAGVSVSQGDDIRIRQSYNNPNSFVSLGQTARDWRGMTTLGNDVYACTFNGDIYKQTNGTGNFVALGQTARNWRGMTTLGNDVYANVYGGDIYKQTNGTGNFVALGQTARNWFGMTTLGNDVYACVDDGDIYKQTNGTGNFVALGQTVRAWRGMTTLGNDVYACSSGSYGRIYKQTDGTGKFVSLGQARRNWFGMTTLGNDVYACVSKGDIYKQTNGTGDFIALGQTERYWTGITPLGNDVYACANPYRDGQIYKQTYNPAHQSTISIALPNTEPLVLACTNASTSNGTYDDFNGEVITFDTATSQSEKSVVIKSGGTTVFNSALNLYRTFKSVYDELEGVGTYALDDTQSTVNGTQAGFVVKSQNQLTFLTLAKAVIATIGSTTYTKTDAILYLLGQTRGVKTATLLPETGASVGTAQNPYSEGYFEEIDTEFIKTGTIEASKHSYGVAVSGTVTFTRSSNTISLAGITANLGLELGDVIQVSGTASNDNLYTVETASANSIVVNYEHRDGKGSLSLTNETKACTIRRIAKWYNAPVGLGQAVVKVRASTETGNFLYTAPPNRSMISMSRMSANANTSRRYEVHVNGKLVHTTYNPSGYGNSNSSVLVPIGGNVEYRVEATSTNAFDVILVR